MIDPIPSLLPAIPGHQFVIYADSCSGVRGALHERTFASVNAYRGTQLAVAAAIVP